MSTATSRERWWRANRSAEPAAAGSAQRPVAPTTCCSSSSRTSCPRTRCATASRSSSCHKRKRPRRGGAVLTSFRPSWLAVVVAVLVAAAAPVRLAAPGLGEATADGVGARDDGDVEPCLSRKELVGAVGVAALDQQRAEQDADDHSDREYELGRLRRSLRLG